jgi:hypothetical protein
MELPFSGSAEWLDGQPFQGIPTRRAHKVS